MVPPRTLESQRLSGSIPRLPDAVKDAAFAALGAQPGTLTTILKVCLDREGSITAITFIKSSGALLLDNFLATHVMRWRYRPYAVNGRATAICGSKVFNVNLR